MGVGALATQQQQLRARMGPQEKAAEMEEASRYPTPTPTPSVIRTTMARRSPLEATSYTSR